MPTAVNDKGEILVLGQDGEWAAPRVAENPQTGERLYLEGTEWKPVPAQAKPAPSQPPYRSSIWPMSVDAQGKPSFDSDAGIVGSIKQAVTSIPDLMSGKRDPFAKSSVPDMLGIAGLISPMPAAVRAEGKIIPGMATGHVKTVPKAPTAEAIKAASDAGYKAAGNKGIEYTGQAAKGLADDLITRFDTEGRIAELAPQTHALIGKLRNPPPGSSIRLTDLDSVRKRLGDIAGNINNRTDASAATIAIKEIDRFLEAANPAALVDRAASAQGRASAVPHGYDFRGADAYTESSAKEAARLLADARGNAAAKFRSDAITGAETIAERNAAVANSGQNIGNAFRQRVNSILKSDKLRRGFSPQEIDALESVARGTAATNTLRYVGNLLGGGGGLGQALTIGGGAGIGGAVGGIPGAVAGGILPAIGAASRATSNQLTASQMKVLDELMRTRSPLYELMKRNAPMAANVSPGQQAAARIALMNYIMANRPAQEPMQPIVR